MSPKQSLSYAQHIFGAVTEDKVAVVNQGGARTVS
jgi:hypothetical protein